MISPGNGKDRQCDQEGRKRSHDVVPGHWTAQAIEQPHGLDWSATMRAGRCARRHFAATVLAIHEPAAPDRNRLRIRLPIRQSRNWDLAVFLAVLTLRVVPAFGDGAFQHRAAIRTSEPNVISLDLLPPGGRRPVELRSASGAHLRFTIDSGIALGALLSIVQRKSHNQADAAKHSNKKALFSRFFFGCNYSSKNPEKYPSYQCENSANGNLLLCHGFSRHALLTGWASIVNIARLPAVREAHGRASLKAALTCKEARCRDRLTLRDDARHKWRYDAPMSLCDRVGAQSPLPWPACLPLLR